MGGRGKSSKSKQKTQIGPCMHAPLDRCWSLIESRFQVKKIIICLDTMYTWNFHPDESDLLPMTLRSEDASNNAFSGLQLPPNTLS